MYCKFLQVLQEKLKNEVLIVAKCIVNLESNNSNIALFLVLIVAKCIVNTYGGSQYINILFVLIVAKCIVNPASYS